MDQPKITSEQVRHVAKLARLALDEQQLAKYAAQLESILAYVAKLQQVDVSGIEPIAHALPLVNVLRDDEPGPTLPLEAVLRNAPQTDGAFFKVPKIIGGGGDDGDSAG
jgi:aspartyl-tRNA(Asn)/glutamyl-tRNA(Gln) amidotransferase subunit C